jgi:iodotyrosine deiodinase
VVAVARAARHGLAQAAPRGRAVRDRRLEQTYGLDAAGGPNGGKVKHYYVRESVGIAVGFLLAALNAAGLATLTHTPSTMGFLREILERPENERAFVVIPVGYPADGATVPDIDKKSLGEVLVRH